VPVPKGDEPLSSHALGPAQPGRGALRGRGAADGAKSRGTLGETYEKMWKTGKPWKIHGNPRKMMYTWYQMVVFIPHLFACLGKGETHLS